MALSLCLLVDERDVYAEFDSLVACMVHHNMEMVDKKKLLAGKVLVLGPLDIDCRAIVTDGRHITHKPIDYHTCFVDFTGVMELILSNPNSTCVERFVVGCVRRAIGTTNHAWVRSYAQLLRDRADAAFKIYFCTLRHWFITSSSPPVAGAEIDYLAASASNLRQHLDDLDALTAACELYHEATARLISSV